MGGSQWRTQVWIQNKVFFQDHLEASIQYLEISSHVKVVEKEG